MFKRAVRLSLSIALSLGLSIALLGATACATPRPKRVHRARDASAAASQREGMLALEMATRVSKLRDERKLPKLKLATYLHEPLRDALAAIAHDEQTPAEALDELLEGSLLRTGHNFRGWYREAASLDKIEIPTDLLEGPELVLSVEVGVYRPTGKAEDRFGVFFAAQDESDDAPAGP